MPYAPVSAPAAAGSDVNCNNCGEKIIFADAAFCDNCGYRLNASSSFSSQQNMQQAVNNIPLKPRKESSKGALAAIIIVCAVLFGVGLYFLLEIEPSGNAPEINEPAAEPAEDEDFDIEEPVEPEPESEDDNDDDSVENVMNMSQDHAVMTLNNQGFFVEIDEVYSNDVLIGHVISQTPAAGSQKPSDNTIRITVSLGPEVTALTITHGGAPVRELRLGLSDEASLGVVLEPVGSITDITWISSDPGIFSVIPNSGGIGAQLTARASGNAILTVTAGNVTQTCIVTVAAIEPPQGSSLRYLFDHMERRNSGVYLNVYWTSGPHTGVTTELVRDPGSNVWFMYGVNDNNREVFPTFDYDGTYFLIKYERSGQTTYYLSENGTGYFLDANGANRQDLTWEFWAY